MRISKSILPLGIFFSFCIAGAIGAILVMFLRWDTLSYLSHYSVLLVGIAIGLLLSWRRAIDRYKGIGLEKSNSIDYKAEYEKLQNRFDLLIEGTNDGIWDWDIARNHLHWSDRAQDLLGLPDNNGMDGFYSLKQVMHVEDISKFEKAMQAHLIGRVSFNVELRIKGKRASDEYRTFLFRGKARWDDDARPTRMAGSISDISDRKKMEEELIHNAFHDSLTGLGNRKHIIDGLERIFRTAKARRGYLFAVLVLDLDKFKHINENFGNEYGDEILRELARRLELCRRSSDFLSRVGGDEFALLLDSLSNPGDANNVAMRIQQEVGEAFVIRDREFNFSCSIGIAFNDGITVAEKVFSNAYTMLRKAKENGRNRIEVFESGDIAKFQQSERKRYDMERKLRNALQNNELKMVYQPIVATVDKSIVGFEALVRWVRDGGESYSPADFIPVAEETGLILPIGEWVLNESCKSAKQWVDAGYTNITVAVNFSARQFGQKGLVGMVEKVLKAHELPARNLKVEITETTAMTKSAGSSHEMAPANMIEKLHQMGLQISIDDFGTGYSSLSYLKTYQFDTLKIDRSFIKDIPDDADDMAITATIISMAKNLGKSLIAEGVETVEQYEYLKEKKCDYIQGFLFSRPVTAETAMYLLEKKYVD
jgi:diguanylate cyclase (GGDEF)-like protein/PAS domain S-box-containing protein